MEKKLIVVVDTDEEYLSALEYKLLEEWEEKADIEIITQLKYFHEFFGKPRNIFLLVINELLFNQKIQKQNCSHILLLSEEEGNAGEERSYKCLYKYSSIREIYMEITKEIRSLEEQIPVERTKVYTVYSVSGGSGKTVSALGIASALEDMGKSVLYLNMESFQDFNIYLEDKTCAAASFGYALAMKDPNLIRYFDMETGNDGFDYLKPFEKYSLSYQISDDSYLFLLEQLKAQKRYDVIVLEISRELTREKLELIEQSDKIVVICMQTEDSAYKLERFLSNMNWQEDQWVFVCNRYKKEEENYLSNQVSLGMYTITEYVDETECSLILEQIRRQGYFQTTAYVME